MTLEIPRRRFLLGMGTLFCAPAIVRAASLMPIKPLDLGRDGAVLAFNENGDFMTIFMREYNREVLAEYERHSAEIRAYIEPRQGTLA